MATKKTAGSSASSKQRTKAEKEFDAGMGIGNIKHLRARDKDVTVSARTSKSTAAHAPVPAQEPKVGAEEYVAAEAKNSPALRRYLLRHYGGGPRTPSEWKRIVEGLQVRKIS